jgi:hypothetical protein
MQTRVIPALALTADEIQAWTTIQRAAPMFQSPFYRPEYVRGVAAVRPGIEVGRQLSGHYSTYVTIKVNRLMLTPL